MNSTDEPSRFSVSSPDSLSSSSSDDAELQCGDCGRREYTWEDIERHRLYHEYHPHAFDPNYKLVPCPHFNCVIDVDIDPDDPRAMEKWIFHVACHWIEWHWIERHWIESHWMFRIHVVFNFICFEHDIQGHAVTDGIFRDGISYMAPNWERMRVHYFLLHGYDDNAASEFADLHMYNGDYRNFWCQWCIDFKQKPIGESVDFIYAHYRNHILQFIFSRE
ncbi:hypothetical protein BDD12DRAFT_811253 [Trichophaea hybrida]|nr:hypothetical protein BDD12DRAFT_811253 [Trichophaea hybrida]